MNYYELPVYNASIKLFKELDTHTQKIPREERYTFVLPVKSKILNIMKYIAKANVNVNKIDFIENAINDVNDIQIEIRGWFEIGRISIKGFAILCDRTEKLSKQLHGWLNTNKVKK